MRPVCLDLRTVERLLANKPMEIKQPAAHLDQMMRQTRAHHVQLSLMADSKANMILTVASLLIPLSIQYLNDPKFKAAAMIMIATRIASIFSRR